VPAIRNWRDAGRLALLAALLAIASCATPNADGEEAFERGVKAYAEGDYAAVLTAWTPLAENGHLRAQYNLGLMYDNGRGVEQNDSKALYWYRKAAAGSHDGAQNNLGLMYAAGQGVSRDDAQAVYWWEKSAAQGYAKAQYNLGIMYMNGWGTARDVVQAYKWLDLAAGLYPPGDDREVVIKNRDELAAAEMTPAEVEAAQRLAREWMAGHPAQAK
jgi:TPR repeat protein